MGPWTLIISETSINEFCWMYRREIKTHPHSFIWNCIAVATRDEIRICTADDNFDVQCLSLICFVDE